MRVAIGAVDRFLGYWDTIFVVVAIWANGINFQNVVAIWKKLVVIYDH